MDPRDLFQRTHPLLGDRVRLAILVTLAAAEEPVDFTTLLQQLELTRGNLATHVRRLEEASLVAVTKEFVDRRPRTTYVPTEAGRTALREYLEVVESLLRATE